MTDSKPTVFEAWSAVMGDVQGIAKRERNSSQGFNFRGIDAVMNAVGPALRSHGVSIIPEDVDIERGTFTTRKGAEMHEVHATVAYRVYGPTGDSFVMRAPGESADAGDKATAKAMSVAYRTALLQSLTIPTDEPDPDQQVYERGPQPTVIDGMNAILKAVKGDKDAARQAVTGSGLDPTHLTPQHVQQLFGIAAALNGEAAS